MSYDNAPSDISPGFHPNPPQDASDEHVAQNGLSDHSDHQLADVGPESSNGSQQQLNVFFPSGDDSELESVLKPLMDATYTGPSGSPDNRSHNQLHHRLIPGQMPTPHTTPGVGPFPMGADHDGSWVAPSPGLPTPPQHLRPTQPTNTKTHITSPLNVPGTVPVAVARSGSTDPIGNGSHGNGYGATYTTGSLNAYTAPQLVHSLVARILAGIPTTAVLERSPEIEQMLAGRFMSALSQIPGPVPANSQPILFKLVVDEILGWGPLEPLMQDPHITEIMVNGPNQVWVERVGQMVDTDVKFMSEDHLMRTATRMAARMGRRLDRKWPMIDGRLADGSRVNIIGPPCAVRGTSITVRKPAGIPLTASRLIEYGTIPQLLADFLRVCVLGRLNIVVAGGSGSGKTTLLNALSSFIPEEERIVTVEESAELKLDHRHVVALETRPPDYEGTPVSPAGGGTGEVTMSHLVANALRMRAERVVVGEIRGGEVMGLVAAMNTGHDGLLATMHASTPRDAVVHLESMALMSGTNLSTRSLREAIASAVDVIVQIAHLRDGTRRVIYVTEVRGMEGDAIALKDIFRWQELIDEETGTPSGVLKPTGHTPRFIYRLQDRGVKVDRAFFSDAD